MTSNRMQPPRIRREPPRIRRDGKHQRWRKANRVLKNLKRDTYVRVLHQLSSDHAQWEFVKPIPGFLRGGRYDLLLAHADSLSATVYADATQHFVANQFASLIKKYPWDPAEVLQDPEATAVKTFLRAEYRCKWLNRKFKLYGRRHVIGGRKDAYTRMRSFIRFTLGEHPNMRRVYASCDYGPGANVGVHGNATHVLRKLSTDVWSCTPGATQYAFVAMLENAQTRELLSPSHGDYWCDDVDAQKASFVEKVRNVSHNIITFVPKTAKTHRAIAIEPLLNGFVQKGIDTEMRLLLKRIQLDLSDQSRNQEWARQGSTDDSDEGYVTIDLSSASDSISTELVHLLLPDAWYDLLNQVRSRFYKLNGKCYAYHKFVSMGNGFCFPLETLLFASCCHAAGAGRPGIDYSVYGDDIIVRKKHAQAVLALLKDMGFTPNRKKTFVEGPFRESCGGDFWKGLDVRPYTLDGELDSIPALFKFLNLTRRSPLTEWFFSGVRSFIFSLIPTSFQLVRPFKGNADTGIDSQGDEYLQCPNVRWHRASYQWVWKELKHSPVGVHSDQSVRSQRLADVYALLRGKFPSKKGKGEHSLRRKTRTSFTSKRGGGPGITWVPGEDLKEILP